MLQSAGALLIQALPTFFVVVLLHWYLKATLFRPIEKVLADRHAATLGAKEKAADALESAERKVAEYEQKLQAARSEIYREQETWRKQLLDEQSTALGAARESNLKLIEEAKAKIATEVSGARQGLDAQAASLSEQIVAKILAGSKN